MGVMSGSSESFLPCHVERSETSLAGAFTPSKRAIQRFFAALRMTISILVERFKSLDPSAVPNILGARDAICS
jgi:hypothetical protein